MSKIAAVRDAVAASLNAGVGASEFATPFTAVAKYAPVEDVTELSGVVVEVVPATATSSLLARSGVQDHQILVTVGVRRQVADDLPATIDPLLHLAEQIAEHFRPGPLGSTGYSWVKTDHKPIYDPAQLLASHTFFSLIQVTFQALY